VPKKKPTKRPKEIRRMSHTTLIASTPRNPLELSPFARDLCSMVIHRSKLPPELAPKAPAEAGDRYMFAFAASAVEGLRSDDLAEIGDYIAKRRGITLYRKTDRLGQRRGILRGFLLAQTHASAAAGELVRSYAAAAHDDAIAILRQHMPGSDDEDHRLKAPKDPLIYEYAKRSVADLRARYQELYGRPTKAGHKRVLAWRIRRAEQALERGQSPTALLGAAPRGTPSIRITIEQASAIVAAWPSSKRLDPALQPLVDFIARAPMGKEIH
jgi:hypothetical protein